MSVTLLRRVFKNPDVLSRVERSAWKNKEDENRDLKSKLKETRNELKSAQNELDIIKEKLCDWSALFAKEYLQIHFHQK